MTSVGLSPFEIVSFVITHLETSFRDGSSNMAVFALIVLVGLVVDSVRETVELLLNR